jgi:hypothetical protein
MDLAPATLTSARSAGLAGSPVRQTMRVEPVSAMRARTASSMSVFDSSDSTTMAASFWLALASISSERIENSRDDQPRTSTWPVSSTGLRPLPRLAMRWSMLDAMRPMSDVKTKMPARVTTSVTIRRPHPASPENVPGSKTRSRACQKDSTKLAESPSAMPSPKSATTAAATKRKSSVARPSQPMSTQGPRARLLSKR